MSPSECIPNWEGVFCRAPLGDWERLNPTGFLDGQGTAAYTQLQCTGLSGPVTVTGTAKV